MLDSPARFIVDTHALWWYQLIPSPHCRRECRFRLAETGNATIRARHSPSSTLSAKLGRSVPPSELLAALDAVAG